MVYKLTAPGVIQGNLEITGNLTVDLNTELVLSAKCDSDLIVKGDETIAGKKNVAGDFNANGKLDVSGLVSGNNAVFTNVLQAGTLTAMNPVSGKLQIASTNTVNKTLIVNDTTGLTTITNVNSQSGLYGPIVVHAQSDGVQPGVVLDVAQGATPSSTPGYVQANGSVKIANKLGLTYSNQISLTGIAPIIQGAYCPLWDFTDTTSPGHQFTAQNGMYVFDVRLIKPTTALNLLTRVAVFWMQGNLSGLGGVGSWQTFSGFPTVYGYCITAPTSDQTINNVAVNLSNSGFYIVGLPGTGSTLVSLAFYTGGDSFTCSIEGITRMA